MIFTFQYGSTLMPNTIKCNINTTLFTFQYGSTLIKYIKLNSYLYWSADRKYYNQMIDIRKVKASRAGEHLIRYRPHYNYALAIDYNKKCIYKKGAAIFLHCTGSNPYQHRTVGNPFYYCLHLCLCV